MSLEDDFGVAIPIDLSQDIRIIKCNDESFETYWKEFIDLMPRCSYIYNKSTLEFLISAASEEHINHSFLIRNNKHVLAIVPLIICNKNSNNYFSLDQINSIPAPLFSSLLSPKNLSKVEKMVLETILAVANHEKVISYFVEQYLISNNLSSFYDCFISKSFKKRPILDLCKIIDLSQSKEKLWNNLRHSYKSIINKGLSTYTFEVFDSKSISNKHLDLHLKLHRRREGGRSIESYESMHNMVINKEGIFHIQYYEGKALQTLYTILGKNMGYGGSTARNHNINAPIPPTHSLNWKMLLDLKKLGIKYYETRRTSYWPSEINGPSINTPKLNSIAEFKRGFSINSYPCLRWVINFSD